MTLILDEPIVVDADVPSVDLRGKEIIDGVVVEKRPMSLEAYGVATEINFAIRSQVDRSVGYVLNEALIYPFDDARRNGRRPDVCFVRADKFPGGLPRHDPEVVPDFVAEVISPTDKIRDVLDRIDGFLSAGVPLVWMVDPVLRRVHVHRPAGPIAVFRGDDEITGEDVMPTFRCPVSRFFPPAPAATPATPAEPAEPASPPA